MEKWNEMGGDICFSFFLIYFKSNKEIKVNEKNILRVK